MADAPTTTTTTVAGANGTPAAAAATTPSTTPTTTPDVAALQAQLAAAQAAAKAAADKAAELEAQVHKGNDENAKRRLAEKEARDKAEAEARAKGESDKVIKSLEEKLVEATNALQKAEAYKDAAARWQSHETSELKSIEDRLSAIPEHFQVLVKGAPSLELKRAVLAAFDKEQASKAVPKPDDKKPATPAPAGGAPPGTPAPVITDARGATAEELKNLKASNEQEYYRVIGGKGSEPVKKTGMFGKLFGG